MGENEEAEIIIIIISLWLFWRLILGGRMDGCKRVGRRE